MHLLLASMLWLTVSRLFYCNLVALTGKLDSGMSAFANYMDALSAAVYSNGAASSRREDYANSLTSIIGTPVTYVFSLLLPVSS